MIYSFILKIRHVINVTMISIIRYLGYIFIILAIYALIRQKIRIIISKNVKYA